MSTIQIPLLSLLVLTLGVLVRMIKTTTIRSSAEQQQGLGILVLISICLFSSSYVWSWRFCFSLYVVCVREQLYHTHSYFEHRYVITFSITIHRYVENEYAIWYLFLNTWILYQLMTEIRKNLRITQMFWLLTTTMTCLRIMRERDQIINFAMLNHLKEPSTMLSGSSVVNEPFLSISPFQCLRLYVTYTREMLLNHS